MKKSKIVASLLLGAVLVGCGSTQSSAPVSSNDTNTESNQTLIGGKATDGYLAKAEVLIDINTTTKGKADSGDYVTVTNNSGDFSIDSNITIPNGTMIYAKGGINVSTGKDFNGTLKGIFNGVKENIILSPLTTMVAAKVEENNISIQEAEQSVAKALDIPTDAVNADPAENKEALKATQQVVAVAKVIQAEDSSKSVSDIIEEIAQNIDDKEDSNFTKAIENTTDEDTAQAAKETAVAVEKAIESLSENFEDNDTDVSVAIENIVTTHVVETAVEAVKNDTNVTEVLEKAQEIVEDTTTIDITNAVACLSFDVIKADNSSADLVTSKLDLQAKENCEKSDVKIFWINATPNNVNLDTGDVIQDNYKNIDVVLEANVSKNDKSAIKPIFFTVAAKAHMPVAVDDIAQTQEDEAVVIDILANDSDEDGLDSLKIEIATKPANGVAEIKDRKIIYTPNENYNGTDSFEYKLIDPLGAEVKAAVNIVVKPTNDAPILDNITIPTITEDSAATTVTLNAKDVDNDKLIYSAVSSDPTKLDVSIKENTLTLT